MGRNVDPSHIHFAKASMNRGHTLASASDPSNIKLAIKAYSEAIQMLDTCELTDETKNTLGAAFMNRGQLRHQLNGTEGSDAALDDFQKALATLDSIASSPSPWPRRNRVGTLVNQANLLIDLGDHTAALQSASAAIKINRVAGPVGFTDAELTTLATRAYCDAAGQLLPSLPAAEQEPLARQAAAHLQGALALIRNLRPYLNHEPFAEVSARLFRFGCFLFAKLQPESLCNLIENHFRELQDESARNQFIDTSREAIKLAITQISQDAAHPQTSAEKQDELASLSQRLGDLYQTLPSL